MTIRVELSGADVEALRLVRDLAREALETTGFSRVKVGQIREVRRTWEGLHVLSRVLGEGTLGTSPEERMLQCVQFAEDRGLSVEIEGRTVAFRRSGAILIRLPDILSWEEPIGLVLAMAFDAIDE